MLLKDIIFCSTILVCTLYMKSQTPLMAGAVLTILYLKLTGRFHLTGNLFAAFFIAVLWVFAAKENYHYGREFTEIGGIALHPIFVWGMGLFAVSLLLSNSHSLADADTTYRFITYSIICITLMVMVEYISYHIFNFRNAATSHYKPVPVINCIHAPQWMQVMYFLLGPLYTLFLLIIEKINVQCQKNEEF